MLVNISLRELRHDTDSWRRPGCVIDDLVTRFWSLLPAHVDFLSTREEAEEEFHTSKRPAKAYEDESVMLSGPHRSISRHWPTQEHKQTSGPCAIYEIS